MLISRIITVVLGIPLIAAVLWLGGIVWQAFFGVLAVVALFEYLRMFKQLGLHLPEWSSYTLMLLCMIGLGLGDFSFAAVLIFAGMMLLLMHMILTYPRYNISAVALSALGALYIGFSLAWAWRMASEPQALAVMTLIFIVVWSSDIGGYLGGRFWGKHHMAPQLSPNKTWEGALCALILPLVLSLLYCGLYREAGINLGLAALLGAAGGVASQLGDLFVSGIKRFCEVKDTGHLLPGHGGVLDRFDSFMLALPLAYMLLAAWGVLAW